MKRSKKKQVPKSPRKSAYPKSPVGILFKTSSRSNAKTKLKVFKTKNIDNLIDMDLIVPGIPERAVILRVVVGEKLIEQLKAKVS